MILARAYAKRWEIHQWLAYVASECPDSGLRPCGWAGPLTCMCHVICYKDMTRHGYVGYLPRRPEV